MARPGRVAGSIPGMEFADHIAEALRTTAAVRIGLHGLRWPASLPRPDGVVAIPALAATGSGEPPRVDLVIVHLYPDTPQGPEPLSTEQRTVLGTARDRVAPRVLAAIDVAGTPSPALAGQLRALGFQDRGTARHDGRSVSVAGFDIDDYKHTPDWLSPRNWANPELWNRYRW